MEKTGCKAYGTAEPVNAHADPDAEYAKTHVNTQNIAEDNSPDPHGGNGDNHSEFDFADSAQRIGKCKSERPEYGTSDAIEF